MAIFKQNRDFTCQHIIQQLLLFAMEGFSKIYEIPRGIFAWTLAHSTEYLMEKSLLSDCTIEEVHESAYIAAIYKEIRGFIAKKNWIVPMYNFYKKRVPSERVLVP